MMSELLGYNYTIIAKENVLALFCSTWNFPDFQYRIALNASYDMSVSGMSALKAFVPYDGAKIERIIEMADIFSLFFFFPWKLMLSAKLKYTSNTYPQCQ